MKKTNLALSLLASACLSLTAQLSSAQTFPASSKLAASYSGQTGDLRIVARFSSAPKRTCTMRLRAAVSYEGQSEIEALRTIFRKRIRSKKIDIKVSGLNAMPLDGDGNRAQLNIQSSLECTSSRIVSGATAVYVVCGQGTKEVTPKVFLRQLEKKVGAL